jgi:hypothetical protein
MSDLIRSVDLKIKRAQSQSKQLIDSINKWVSNNQITGRCELREERLGFRLILNEFNEPAPVNDWSLAIGEYIHNLRSSLDNLAFALARLQQDPPSNPNVISFPIFQDKSQFEKKARPRLNQLPAEAASLIEMIQPFQRDGSPALGTPESDALILLQWLNNTDKHRIPSLVLFPPSNLAHSFSVEYQSEEDAAANVPPDMTIWTDPLQAGAVLLEHRTKHPIASVKGECKVHAIISLQTNRNPVPVDPTIPNLGYYTELVIAQFRKFFV